MAVHTCVENYSGAVLRALAASISKRRQRNDPRPVIPAAIQNEIRTKTRLQVQWQITRDRALKAEVNRLQRSVIRRLNEWRNDQWSTAIESFDPEDQSLWRMTRPVKRVPTPYPLPGHHRGFALSDSEKAEALADNLKAQFQLVTDLSVPTVEMFDVALRSYLLSSVNEPQVIIPEDVHEAIKCLKVSKAPRPDGIPNRTLKHHPKRVVFLLPCLQRGSSHPSLSPNLEARSGDIYP